MLAAVPGVGWTPRMNLKERSLIVSLIVMNIQRSKQLFFFVTTSLFLNANTVKSQSFKTEPSSFEEKFLDMWWAKFSVCSV